MRLAAGIVDMVDGNNDFENDIVCGTSFKKH